MAPGPDRRRFLQLLAGGAAAVFVSERAAAQHLHASIAANSLTDDIVLLSGAGGNVLVLTQPDGVLMVNGGLPDRSADLLDAVARHSSGARVQTLFNTDWHPEHTGSNETLGEAGARIIAHEHTRQYLSTELFVEWQNRTYTPRPPHALPTETFRTSGTITFGSERIDYGHLGQAHTDGDMYVFLPGPNVLMAGDVVTAGTYPIADYVSGGWLGGMATATKTLLDLTDAQTRVVPGIGPLQTRADLQAQHDMLVAMRDRLSKMMRQGMGAEDMLAAGATKDFDGKWGNPELFVSTAYRGLWLHVRELGGIV